MLYKTHFCIAYFHFSFLNIKTYFASSLKFDLTEIRTIIIHIIPQQVMNTDKKSLRFVNLTDNIELCKDDIDLHDDIQLHKEEIRLHQGDIDLNNDDIELLKENIERRKESIKLQQISDTALPIIVDVDLQQKGNIELHYKDDIELHEKFDVKLHQNAYAEVHQAANIHVIQRAEVAPQYGADLDLVENKKLLLKADAKFKEANQRTDVELNQESESKAGQRDDGEANQTGSDKLQQRTDTELHYKICVKLQQDDEHNYSELDTVTNIFSDRRADGGAKDIKINFDIDFKEISDYEDIDSMTAVAVIHS